MTKYSKFEQMTHEKRHYALTACGIQQVEEFQIIHFLQKQKIFYTYLTEVTE